MAGHQPAAAKLSPSTVTSETLDKHLAMIRQQIIDEAHAEPGSSAVPSESAIWRAAIRYAPGMPFEERIPMTDRIIDRLSNGMANRTTLLATMTISFALMGLLGAGLFPGANVSTDAAKALAPFLDISKIFAGAIVGSATANIVPRFRRTRDAAES